MRLHTQEWGTGDRLAVLVHGIMTDDRTWHELTPVLTGLGYRVLAVDLRGHGAGARGAYAPALFAEDLLDTLARRPELVLGHSLGALALALAVEKLAPARAVHSEPAWRLSSSAGGLDPAYFTLFKRSPDLLTSFSRPLDAAEGGRRLAVERQALDAWDEHRPRPLRAPPRRPHAGVGRRALAGPGVGPEHARQRAGAGGTRATGLRVRTVSDAPHAIHRDRFDAFVESLSGWL